MKRPLPLVFLLASAVLGASCASGSGPSTDDDQPRYATRGLSKTSARTADGSSAAPTDGGASRPVIAINGQTLAEGTVWPMVAEGAGSRIVDEIVLTRVLETECARAGIAVTESDVEAERTLFLRSVAGFEGGADPDRALDRIRRDRGLGPARWKALLRRNAMLRALVRDEVVVSEEAITRTYQLRYGPSWTARVIVVSAAVQAGDVVRRARAGEDFGALAASVSIDPSASRGGVVDPINPADTTWPLALRQAVQSMHAGDVSEPIVVDSGFAILRVESESTGAGSPALSAVRAQMEQAARIEAERLAMQQLADSLRSTAKVEVLDSSLGW